MNAVVSARKNGGSLFYRTPGCAEAVRRGWLELIMSTSRVSTGGGMGRLNLTRYERKYGWIDRQWKVTETAPVGTEAMADIE